MLKNIFLAASPNSWMTMSRELRMAGMSPRRRPQIGCNSCRRPRMPGLAMLRAWNLLAWNLRRLMRR